MSTKEELYGTLKDGRPVQLFTLNNNNGMTARVTNFGAILVALEVPDKNGIRSDVTLGYDKLEDWVNDSYYFGASVGRFGNRIANGKFTLDSREYPLATNNAPGDIPCHLHGGIIGFNKALWDAEPIANGVKFTHISPDGDEGYPGEVHATITYLLNNDNELIWTATATTTCATPVNLVHHTYWNLSNTPGSSILDHILSLNANHYLPTNPGMIPTGELQPVANTPMDFLRPTPVGDRIDDNFEALQLANGYDHAWVINGQGLRHAATVTDPKTGRTLAVSTNQPAVQFYAGNFLDGAMTGKGRISYQKRTGLCLETEQFPDSPNQPAFPSCILHPGETYKHVLIHKLSW